MAETPLKHTSHWNSFGAVEGAVEKPAQGHAARFAVYPDDSDRRNSSCPLN